MPVTTRKPRPKPELPALPDEPEPVPLDAAALLREAGLTGRAIREILARPGNAGPGGGQE